LLLTAIFGFAFRSSMLAPRLGAALAAVYLGLGPWGGHAAGAESPWTVLLPNVVHVIATAAWAGACSAEAHRQVNCAHMLGDGAD
jgi:putative copper export protein